MRVIGDTLTARVLLRELLANEVMPTWYVPEAATPALPLDLTLLPGPTLSLAQHSRNLWQTLAKELPFAVLQPLTLLDLATTPGRAVKLREEALLDALAGETCEYLETAPQGLHPRLVLGARQLQEAPMLAPTLPADWSAQLATLGVTPQPLPPDIDLAWLTQEPTALTDTAVAMRVLPQLQAVAVRGHRLEWTLPESLPLPQAPLLLLHRMPRGHTWIELTATQVVVWYDGLNDPRQTTADPTADAATVAALTQHVGQLLPLFARSVTTPPKVTTVITNLLPDLLPLVGPLAPDSPLWMACGMGLREALYAPGLAERLIELWRLDEHIKSPLEPMRLAALGPQPLRVPESLQFEEPVASVVAVEETVTRATTQLSPEPEVKRATEVRMVGKEVVSGSAAMLLAKTDKAKPQSSS